MLTCRGGTPCHCIRVSFFGVRIGLVQEMESGNNRDIQIQISSPFLCFHERKKKNHQFDLRSICLLYVMSCTAGAICRGCHCGICSAANASVERAFRSFVVYMSSYSWSRRSRTVKAAGGTSCEAAKKIGSAVTTEPKGRSYRYLKVHLPRLMCSRYCGVLSYRRPRPSIGGQGSSSGQVGFVKASVWQSCP